MKFGRYFSMPRHPRNDYPDAVHHVYARGNEKRVVFLDDRDGDFFLSRLKKNLARWEIRCIAWALMPNHFHLLVRCPKGNLASLMQCLLTGYSLYFNKRYQRVGHLFQNRYKSEALTREGHYRELLRYIHLNPVRAGILSSMEELSRYPWTGHRGIVWERDCDWQDMETVREMFRSPRRSWQREYLDFLEAGIRPLKKVSHTGMDRSSQGEDFQEREISSISGDPPAMFFEILESIYAFTGISLDEIKSKGRSARIIHARRLLLASCRDELKVPVSKISRWIGIPMHSAWYLLRSGGDQISTRPDWNS
jgi:REP element-mobilizing transposase RayT